jgi:hypothetical protein
VFGPFPDAQNVASTVAVEETDSCLVEVQEKDLRAARVLS